MNPLLIKVLIVLMALTGSYQFGRHVKTGEVAVAQQEATEAIADLKQEKQDIADTLGGELARLRAEKAPKEKTITKEITRYVEVTPAADRCTLPGTWRVRHDSAATGQPFVTETGSVAAGAIDPVEDAAALETVAENYAIARECSAKLAGWHTRYKRLEQ